MFDTFVILLFSDVPCSEMSCCFLCLLLIGECALYCVLWFCYCYCCCYCCCCCCCYCYCRCCWSVVWTFGLVMLMNIL